MMDKNARRRAFDQSVLHLSDGELQETLDNAPADAVEWRAACEREVKRRAAWERQMKYEQDLALANIESKRRGGRR